MDIEMIKLLMKKVGLKKLIVLSVFALLLAGGFAYYRVGVGNYTVFAGDPIPTDCTDNCSYPNESCFMPGTEVDTADGKKKIEEIKAGEVVKSFDEVSGEIVESVVDKPYSVTRDHYYVLTTKRGNEVKVTDEHPFFVGFEKQGEKSLAEIVKAEFVKATIALTDRLHGIDLEARRPDYDRKYHLDPGFVRVMDLTIGDRVYVKEEGKLVEDRVAGIAKYYGEFEVYNLMLEGDYNTFFADNFAVHNKKSDINIGAYVICRDEVNKVSYPLNDVTVAVHWGNAYGKTSSEVVQTRKDGTTRSFVQDREEGNHNYFTRVRVVRMPEGATLENGAPYSQMVLDETAVGAFRVEVGNGFDTEGCSYITVGEGRRWQHCDGGGRWPRIVFRNCSAAEQSPTPTPPTTGAVCLNVKIYQEGSEISDFSQIIAGGRIRLAVAGQNANQARFRVNGAAWMVTTSKNGRGEFYVDYTVPASGGALTINAEVSP